MKTQSQPGTPDRVLAAGGLIGALLGASCCVLPLALVTVGVGGSWMARLTALAPYKWYMLAVAAVLLGIGFRQAHRQGRECAPGSLCAVPASRRMTRSALWVGAVLVALSASVDLWAPFFW